MTDVVGTVVVWSESYNITVLGLSQFDDITEQSCAWDSVVVSSCIQRFLPTDNALRSFFHTFTTSLSYVCFSFACSHHFATNIEYILSYSVKCCVNFTVGPRPRLNSEFDKC